MTKKKAGILIGFSFLVILTSIYSYWFYFSKPVTFPTNKQVVKEMGRVFPEATGAQIQEVIHVDERHVVVPYITVQDEYGLSYWVWKKHKWRAASVFTNGEPKVWKINNSDPSTYYIVWNIHPKDQVSTIDFYLMRDRGFQVSNGIGTYTPKVQMEKKVKLQGKSYGVMQMPVQWMEFINAIKKVESPQQPDFVNFFPERTMSFGWIPYNQSGDEARPQRTLNGGGFQNSVEIEYIRFLNKAELERP